MPMVPVVDIREMSMDMDQGVMPVQVHVFLPLGDWEIMVMLVMLVVGMFVAMFHGIVNMLMFVPLREM